MPGAHPHSNAAQPGVTTAFPPPPLRRLVSTSLRRLLPRPRPLIVLPGGGGGEWFRFGRRRKKTPAEEVAAVALVLALGGHRLAALAEAWNASGLGQVLNVLAAVLGRRQSRRGGGLRRLAAFLLSVAVCALLCHMRGGAAFLEGIQKTGGGSSVSGQESFSCGLHGGATTAATHHGRDSRERTAATPATTRLDLW